MADAPLLEAQIQVGVGESARAPMLGNDGVAWPGREIGVPFAAPFTPCEVMAVHDLALGGRRVVPVLVVARFPAPMRHDEHRNATGADGTIQRTQVVEQADFGSDGLYEGIDPAAFREEVVVGIDQQVGGSVDGVGRVRHGLCLVSGGDLCSVV
ncbi:hypothetical protein FQZ97_853290 [compost metagenome]